MNNITDFQAHKRDEDFDREDAKSRHATHAERVAFADAMMATHSSRCECDECEAKPTVCETCDGAGEVEQSTLTGGPVDVPCPDCAPVDDREDDTPHEAASSAVAIKDGGGL